MVEDKSSAVFDPRCLSSRLRDFCFRKLSYMSRGMSDKHNLIVIEDIAIVIGDHNLIPYVPKCSNMQSTLHLWLSALVTVI